MSKPGKPKQKINYPDVLRPEIITNFNNFKTKNKPKLKNKKNTLSFKPTQNQNFNTPNSNSRSNEIELEITPDYSALPIMRGAIKHVSPKRSRFKIVVRKVERPFKDDFEHQLAWICSSLGFFEPIDKEKNAAAVFKEIVLSTEKGEALSSTALAERVGMSRGAVINHLNNLLRSGLIEKNGRFYVARSRSMKRTIEEIEEDVDRIFSSLKRTAEELDKQIGFDEEEQ